MAPAPRYFRLRDHIGGSPDDPIASYGVAYAVPAQRDGRFVREARRVRLARATERVDGAPGRILPNSRVIEAVEPALAAALAQDPKLEETDPPAELQRLTEGTLSRPGRRGKRTTEAAGGGANEEG